MTRHDNGRKSRVLSESTDSIRAASVGYELDIFRYMALFYAIDPRYKMGAEIDFLLQHRHSIRNLNTCFEGAYGKDEYRIVLPNIAGTAEVGKGPPDVGRSEAIRIGHRE
jgi:hypothetical protein